MIFNKKMEEIISLLREADSMITDVASEITEEKLSKLEYGSIGMDNYVACIKAMININRAIYILKEIKINEE